MSYANISVYSLHVLDIRREANLVKLQADQASDQRRSRGNGRDDLAGNLLGRMPVGGVDAVVQRTQVRRGGDEVNVVIRVVVLLELDRVQTVADERRRGRELLEVLLQVYITAGIVLGCWVVIIDLDLDATFGDEFWDYN